MYKYIISLLIFTNILTASENNFFDNLNKTMTQDFYTKLYTIKDLNNSESNRSKVKIIRDFESLLPQYLNSKDIEEVLKIDNWKTFLSIHSFLKISSMYLNLRKNEELLNKNLSDLNGLISKPYNLDSYNLSIIIYMSYYQDTNFESDNYKRILKKHPIPSSDVYFQKLHQFWDETNDVNILGINNSSFMDTEEIKSLLIESLKNQMNDYKKSYTETIKKNSVEELKKWRDNLQIEQNELSSEKTKKILLKGMQEYEKERNLNNYQHIINLIAKQTVLLTVTLLTSIPPAYFNYIQLVERYKVLSK